MTKTNRLYGFILPISSEEYSRGNKYISITNAIKDDKNGIQIELVEKTNEEHDGLGKVKKTVKKMHCHNKVPFMIRKLVPSKACTVRETSFSSLDKIKTIYHNEHFSDTVFNITINTTININPFENIELEHHDMSKVFGSTSNQNIICYKHVSVEVNQYFLGWVAHEIDNSIRKVLIEHHEKIVTKKDDWIDMNIEDLEVLEDRTFKYNST